MSSNVESLWEEQMGMVGVEAEAAKTGLKESRGSHQGYSPLAEVEPAYTRRHHGGQ